MEDADGGLSFDFEGGLDAAVAQAVPPQGGQVTSTVAAAAVGASNGGGPAAGVLKTGQGTRRNFRQTVCRHWLRGLCMKGELCGFLHQLDKGRMPVCRFYAKYGECREPDCPYKHTNEDIKECNMYKLGFCPNGPDCRYRHVKMPGPFPPVEESLQKIQLRVAVVNGGQNGRYAVQRHGVNLFQEEAQPWPSVPTMRADGIPATGEEAQNGHQHQHQQQQHQHQHPHPHHQQQEQQQQPPPPPQPQSQPQPQPQPPQPQPQPQQQQQQQQQQQHQQQQQQQQPQPQQRQQQQQQQQQQLQQQLQLPPPPPLPPPQQRSQRPQQQQTVSGQNRAQSSQQQPMANGPASQSPSFVSESFPLPQGYSRYFIVKSSNRENLELSVARGLWATHRNNEAKLNEAFDLCDNVILIFSVNETRHFQGCARMMSKIGVIVGGGGWKYAHGTAHYGRNFRLKWLKLCELSFNKTRHLRNPYNDNLPVKISRDCQELESAVGDQLASLLYMEPDSDLMKVAHEIELKREEEKARGTSSGQEPAEDTNIVPYEDIDEDQEDDESDEDDSSSQTASQNRGKPNMVRNSHASLGLSGRGNRGRGRNITGDSFGLAYDRFAGDGFNMPGAAPNRGFSPYHQLPRYGAPDFSGLRAGAAMGFAHMDGSVPVSGMVFASRPPSSGMFPHNGPAMMGPPGTALITGVGPANLMATSRPHFVGGPGTGRHGRPGGMPFRSPQAGGRGRRGSSDQQRRRKNERNIGNERLVGVGEPRNMGKAQKRFPASGETSGLGEVDLRGPAQPQQRQDGGFAKNSFTKDDDESSSEDEAPRRSRHGEGKKRRRDWQGEDTSVGTTWDQQVEQGDQWVGTDPLEVAY